MSTLRAKVAQLLIVTASLGAVATVALVDVRRASPGPVAHAHASVAALESGQACSVCHGGWWTDMADACLACHAPIEEQLAEGSGLHGTLAETPGAFADARRCGHCHGEHHGADFTLVHTKSFQLAGVPDVAAFDHARVGLVLEGRHTELACAECHIHADVAQLAEGQRRYLGLERSCAACHTDPHAGAFALACTACHVQTSFDRHVAVEHERHLALTGGHGALSCRACHATGASHSLEVLAGRRTRPPARGCADCHDDPHAPGFVAGIAQLEGVPRSAACSVCHAPEDEDFHADGLALARERHALTRFPLDGAHAALDCESCHTPDPETSRLRFTGTARRCEDCHSDAHEGAFAAHAGVLTAEARGTCAVCHGTEAFGHVPSFDHAAFTAFALAGAHAEAECAACHAPRTEPDVHGRRFGRAAERFFAHSGGWSCARCHGDPHRLEGGGSLRGPDGGAALCADCHEPTSFRLLVAPFDHGAATGFALDGAHASADCSACHAPLTEPDSLGRTTAPAHGRACSACHADPHAGQFERFDPAGAALGADCARCHSTSGGFRADAFDHRWDTEFPLDATHAGLACSACHRGERMQVGGAARELVRYKPLGRQCADCHGELEGALRRRLKGRGR